MGALNVSEAPCPGGIKTPSRVPKEFQELNFQQIQILIEKLEALKHSGHADKKSSDQDIEDEHLYDLIPEPELEDSTKRREIAKQEATRTRLPPRSPKSPKPNVVEKRVGLKPDTTKDKPKKPLGE